MKANVPEKLYIISDEEGVILSLDNATDSRGDRYDFVDEAVFPFEDGTFEYTRTDAFIEKACDFFEENIEEEDCKIGSSEWTELRAEYKSLDSFIRAFVEYMEGEEV